MSTNEEQQAAEDAQELAILSQINPYSLLPTSEWVDTDSLDTPYESPEQAADLALANPSFESERLAFASQVMRDNQYNANNRTANLLYRVYKRGQEAAQKLSLIGYTGFRHLFSQGLTITEIAQDLDMNPLDITAYMSQHAQAKEHAQMDAASCADTKITEFLQELENKPPVSKFEADRRNVQYKVLLEQVKRISVEWADLARRDENDKDKGNTFNFNVNIGHAQVDNKAVRGDTGQVIDITPSQASLAEEGGVVAEGCNAPEEMERIQRELQGYDQPSLDAEGYFVDPLGSQENDIPPTQKYSPHNNKPEESQVTDFDFD